MKQSSGHRKQIVHVRVVAFRLSPLWLLQGERAEPRTDAEFPEAHRVTLP
jgi:hypothetical protein